MSDMTNSNAVRDTSEILNIIGTPFENAKKLNRVTDDKLVRIYEHAFYNRVAPLYLHMYRRDGWCDKLKELYVRVKEREAMTLTVLSDLAANLNDWNEDGYVIFKSLKPYPAIPNDTDVLIFGGKREFKSALEHLYSKGYLFHEWAPMQTTLYDARGKGKIGVGKKGGTYYIDIYQNISTDYVNYLDEKAIKPHAIIREINGINVRILKKEPELAVILFHNVFPERTFQLEHFYMPLYYLADPEFDTDLFVRFTEENRMTYPVKTNLSLIEKLHHAHFGFVPDVVTQLLEDWGRNWRETDRFVCADLETPYMFSPVTFWNTCIAKLGDTAFTNSLFVQGLHMLNPVFFWDVMLTLKKRFSERGAYHME
ncbi:MAG TPA: hypothetical protein VMW42_12975 [Desulfatiglandales bacterium]|nr:hypothetical protein [Desulfatiglandales bacterium]